MLTSRVDSDLVRLSTVQGNGEARTELYGKVLRGSTGASDAVMSQEFWQGFVLCAKAGQNGGGV